MSPARWRKDDAHYTVQTVGVQALGLGASPSPTSLSSCRSAAYTLPPGPQTHCRPEPVRWLWLSPALKRGWGCPQLCVDHEELASQLRPPPPRPFCTRSALWGLREESRVGPRAPHPLLSQVSVIAVNAMKNSTKLKKYLKAHLSMKWTSKEDINN